MHLSLPEGNGVKFRQNRCMDDKHRVKVGEPNHPVATAERGKKVLVSQDTTFKVADHNFTKFMLVPSIYGRWQSSVYLTYVEAADKDRREWENTKQSNEKDPIKENF